MVSILDRVYEEGKAETLTHPFVQDEPIFTREDKSYKAAKHMLNELVKYSNSHHRSVIKNWTLMCIIFILLLAKILLQFCIYLPKIPHYATYYGVILNIDFLVTICLVVLIPVTTCLDVPCCWKFGHKIAKFSIFRNLHIVRLVLVILVIFSVIYLYTSVLLNYITAVNTHREVLVCESINGNYSSTTSCTVKFVDNRTQFASFPLNKLVYLFVLIIFILDVCFLTYVIIMLVVIINVKCCCYKNSFRPIRSCRNLAHEIIMIDIFDDNSTKCQSRLPDDEIEILEYNNNNTDCQGRLLDNVIEIV